MINSHRLQKKSFNIFFFFFLHKNQITLFSFIFPSTINRYLFTLQTTRFLSITIVYIWNSYHLISYFGSDLHITYNIFLKPFHFLKPSMKIVKNIIWMHLEIYLLRFSCFVIFHLCISTSHLLYCWFWSRYLRKVFHNNIVGCNTFIMST